MTYKDYNSLNQADQEDLLFNEAIFISHHSHDNSLIDVYELGSFYIECCYSLYKNEPARITAADHKTELPFKQQTEVHYANYCFTVPFVTD